ncbi:MAG: response regulator transcription factor [Anaerolineae bacterium]
MHTVMLVEDDREVGRLVKFLLELEGYCVVSTDVYEDVLPLLQETQPDLMLMDVHVRGKETIDLISRVRVLDSRAADTVLVMTSARDCYLECLQAGADRFIPKPFLPDQIVEEVGCLCEPWSAK